MAVQSVQPSEGPELVQLLTPEGERVEHPDYALDLSVVGSPTRRPRHVLSRWPSADASDR